MDPIVHFEIPYEDRDRMAEFYKKAFGWQPHMMGPEFGDYVVVRTTETDEKTMFPTKPGRINGGLYKKSKEGMNDRPRPVIAVADIEAALKKIEGFGGKVMDKPAMIPGTGLYATFLDSEGNKVGIIQPQAM